MKKINLLLALLMAVTYNLQAQEIVTDFYHENGKYFNMRNIVETTDSCMIVECPMFEAVAVSPDLGDMFYKVTLDGRLVDSLFIEIEDVNLRTLLAQDPQDPDNYLYAYFDMTQDSVLLKMTYFDRNFNIRSTKEIPFDYPAIGYYPYDYFLDPYGDIIASFSSRVDSLVIVSFNRIAFDGTIKYSREVPGIRNFARLQSWHSWIYRQSPLQYCYWGSENGSDLYDRPPIRSYVIDSLFNVTDEHCYYLYNGLPFGNGWQEHIIPQGDEHYLLATRYNWFDYSALETHRTVLLAKFDREHEMVASGLYGEEIGCEVNPICTASVNDTLIYFAYMKMNKETDQGITSELTLLCMDNNLNVNWERHYQYPSNHIYWGMPMCVLENGDIAIGSFRYSENPGNISVVLFRNNGTTGIPEMETFVRPYTYYPNPTQDQLHLQYSPDVLPKAIELFDLQGRQVRTQSKSLGSVNMQSLAPGQYLMKVTLEDGKSYTDKVVKE